MAWWNSSKSPHEYTGYVTLGSACLCALIALRVTGEAVQELKRQQKEIDHQQKELDRQQDALSEQQEELGERMEEQSEQVEQKVQALLKEAVTKGLAEPVKR